MRTLIRGQSWLALIKLANNWLRAKNKREAPHKPVAHVSNHGGLVRPILYATVSLALYHSWQYWESDCKCSSYLLISSHVSFFKIVCRTRGCYMQGNGLTLLLSTSKMGSVRSGHPRGLWGHFAQWYIEHMKPPKAVAATAGLAQTIDSASPSPKVGAGRHLLLQGLGQNVCSTRSVWGQRCTCIKLHYVWLQRKMSYHPQCYWFKNTPTPLLGQQISVAPKLKVPPFLESL